MKKSDLLSPFGLIYGAVAGARSRLYETGVFKPFDLGARTVSIGNITAGGTGKTPLVVVAARVLAARGETVCILTRGYKRANERERVLVSDGEKIFASVGEAGDEPLELAQKLLGKAAVVADANRAEAGNWARQNLKATAFVLDDAFQHLRVKRDLDIVCVDASNPFGNGKFLPAGILREPLGNLRRAGAVIITRANLVDDEQFANLKIRISKFNPAAQIFRSENRMADLTDLGEFFAKGQNSHGSQKNKELAIRRPPRAAYLAFCGLGNPDSFFEQLHRENFKLAGTKTFPDHHLYTQKDIDRLAHQAEARGAEILLTTAKDAVKLKDLRFEIPCLVVESELIFDDEESLKKLIAGVALSVDRNENRIYPF